MRRIGVLAAGLAVALLLAVPAALGAKPGNSVDAKACQKNGWMSLYTRSGEAFTNGGHCTSYAAHGGQLIVRAALACLNDGWKTLGPTPSQLFASEQACVDFANGGGTPVPAGSDLALAKSVSDATPNVGDTITFTVTLNDNGPATATNVSVQDLLPAGLTFVSDNPSQGSYEDTTGIWDVGTILDTESETLEIVATVHTNCCGANIAEVSDSTTYDTNSVPGSGDSNGDTYDSVTVTPDANPLIDAAADVAVSGPSKANATSKGFTVLIRNAGSQNFTLTNANLETSLNGNESAVSCKAFSATVKPGRSVRVHCSANIATLGLTPPQTVTYSATVDVPTDGFTQNDEDSEVRATS